MTAGTISCTSVGTTPDGNAYVRVQPGTKQPMGPLANGDLRHLRIRAHRAFDRVWQCGVKTRAPPAYRWMAGLLLHSAA